MTIQQAFELAMKHHRSGRLGQAELICRQILALEPNHAEALHRLGLLAGQTGRLDLAQDLIGRAIAAAPGRAEFLLNLGAVLRRLGQLDQAIACYQRALEIAPDHPAAHNNLGNVFRDKGSLDQAIACYQRAVAIRPEYADAYSNLGAAWLEKGQLEQSIACLQRALAIQPDHGGACNNLGNAFKSKGQLDQAIACYQRALEIKGDDADAQGNLGAAWIEKGELDRSIACCRRALEIRPDFADAHFNLGNALRDKGQLDGAIASYQRAITVKGDHFQAHNNLGNAWKSKGHLDEALACYRKAMEINPRFVNARDNLLHTLHYHPASDAGSLLVESQKWNQQHAEPLRQFIQPHGNDRDLERRLRIGYVSPDLRNHPVGRFVLPLLAGHDRNAFEVFCYAQVPRPDNTSAKLQSQTSVWRGVVGLSDEQVAEMIRQDRIDILVDLAMHTANNRLLVFARKPAPVQATYLGCVGTSGLQTMDYRFTDRYLDPDEADDRYYTEKSIRLPGTYWCYQPNDTAPPVNDLPALKTGRITLGCLNNYCKVTAGTLETWAALLRRLGQAVLLLRSPEGNHREGLIRFMQERGIDPARLLISQVSPAEYFQAYGRMDLALDPFPYPGGSTTCDALWMGVPVVTLSGRIAAGRAGVSILSNAGLPELIAHTPEEYVEIAANLAGDLPRLGEMRLTMRRRMRSSPLMDAAGFARGVESAYRQMWRQWCTGHR